MFKFVNHNYFFSLWHGISRHELNPFFPTHANDKQLRGSTFNHNPITSISADTAAKDIVKEQLHPFEVQI